MKLSDLPDWMEPTLQGLAFWLAYKKQFYNGYTLSEGAIVGELAQGINASIDGTTMVLECERMYKELADDLDGQTRLDLAVGHKSQGKKEKKSKTLDATKLVYAIEVKRYENGWSQILSDIEKLGDLKKKNKDIRCFLIVVSQDLKPEKLVSIKDRPLDRFLNEDLGGRVRTKNRTVKKAFSTKQESQHGNFAVLIEVS